MSCVTLNKYTTATNMTKLKIKKTPPFQSVLLEVKNNNLKENYILITVFKYEYYYK